MDIVEIIASKALKNAIYLYEQDTTSYLNVPLLDVATLNDDYAENTAYDICEYAVELLTEWLTLNGLYGTADYDSESVSIS